MNCEQAQQEIAVSLLTREAPDDAVTAHVSTCPACAAEQASLRPVTSLLATVSALDLQHPALPENDLFLQRLLSTVARENRVRRRRSLATAVIGVAAAGLIVVLALAAVTGVFSPPPQAIRASASTAAIQATADIVAQGSGSSLTVSIAGVTPGTHCVMQVVTKDGASQVIADWKAEYDGTASVTGTAGVPPASIASVRIVSAAGPVLLTIPVTT